MTNKKLEIKETKDGLYFNGIKQIGAVDVQVIKNLHRKVKVQVTYYADSFLKEDFGNSFGDGRDSDR